MKKIYMLLFFSFLSLISLSFISAFSGLGSGSEADPYQITNCLQLQEMGEDGLEDNYILMNNINCSDTINWNGGLGFKPIGNNSNPTSVLLNGQNYIISNLYINRPVGNYVGLFGYLLTSSGVYNIHLRNVSITGYYYVGGLVGITENSLIYNVSVTGVVNGGSDGAGGLIGILAYTDVNNSYAIVDVTGLHNVGGLIGETDNVNIYNSYAIGNVTGEGNRIGGLIGNNDYGNIFNSYAVGNIKGTEYQSEAVGGLVGYNTGNIYRSYSTGTVWIGGVGQTAGGLAGENYGNITNSFSGSRVAIDGNYVGGLVGKHLDGKIINSYSSGYVNGFGFEGGLIGWSQFGETINSYWDINTSNQFGSSGGTGKTTLQMKNQTTFTGWNFNTIWNSECSYPFLRGLPVPFAIGCPPPPIISKEKVGIGKAISNTIKGFNSMFPDASTLSALERYSMAFILIFIITIVILISLKENIELAIMLSLIIDILIFIYFIVIGYIGLGTGILIGCIILIISLFKMEKRGGGV